jgi:hypothetical protein
MISPNSERWSTQSNSSKLRSDRLPPHHTRPLGMRGLIDRPFKQTILFSEARRSWCLPVRWFGHHRVVAADLWTLFGTLPSPSLLRFVVSQSSLLSPPGNENKISVIVMLHLVIYQSLSLVARTIPIFPLSSRLTNLRMTCDSEPIAFWQN